MKAEELDTVARLADILRAKGVKTFEGCGFRMELQLGPEPVADSPLPRPPAVAQEDEETCKCGHPHYAHQGGLCIHACPVEKCAPEETP